MPDFLHGLEVVDATTPSAPLRVVRNAVLGIVGSGTDLEEPGRRNVPVLVRGARDAAAKFGGPLGQYLQGILERVSTLIVVVNVFDPATMFGAYGDGEEVTLAAGSVVVADVPADADIEVRSKDLVTTYGIGDATAHLSWDPATGTLTRNAVAGAPAVGATLNFRYRKPDPVGAAAADVAGTAAGRTGVYALLDADGETGYRPGLIGAPGYSGAVTGVAPNVAAPAGSALQTVGDRMRAGFAIEAAADGSLADDTALRELFSSRRGYLVSPWASRVVDGAATSEPGTVQALAAMAANELDAARGYWFSPTGVRLPQMVATSRPIDWGISDKLSEANLLNEQHIATFVRSGGVFILWGDRSLSEEDKWKFWSVGRVADVLAETLIRAHVAFVSRPYDADYWRTVAGNANAILRGMRQRGAIRYGRCIRSDRNTPQTEDDGHAIWRIEFDPAPPTERLTFELALTRDPDRVVEEI